jgi:hypothetical protein
LLVRFGRGESVFHSESSGAQILDELE